MSHDPLHAPLKPRRWRDRLRLPASPALLALAVILAAVAGLFAWAWLQPPPPPSVAVAEQPLPPRPSPATSDEETRARPEAALTTTRVDEAHRGADATTNRKAPAGARIITVPSGSNAPTPAATGDAGRDKTLEVRIADAVQPLPPVPARDLVERTRFGPLPRVGHKGRQPWRVYARPVTAAALASPLPGLAVLVVDLGLDETLTDTAIRELPPQVSLAFAPRGSKVRSAGLLARRHGHEFFLQVPMEPWGYPAVNPGPDTLLTSLDAAANRQRLRRLLARAVGYAGVVTYAGQKLLRNGEALSPVLHELKKRGLLVVDDGTTADSMLPALALVVGLPALRADVRLPPGLQRGEARGMLEQARQLARQRGRALVVVSADAANLQALRAWLADVTQTEGDIVLLPVTALAKSSNRNTAR